MAYLFEVPNPAVPVVQSSDMFPVRRIYCVGRNYEAHAREMGHDPQREPPFFFSKPADAVLYVAPGTVGEFPYPPESGEVHHEMELVVAIGRGGRDIPVEHALEHVYGYALGLDMTRRDLQAQAKKLGRPWDMAKGFDLSAPIGPIHPVSQVGHVAAGQLWLTVNGAPRQRADVSTMLWPVPETIAYLSRFITLAAGDLVYTGTPEGVAAVAKGDVLEGGLDGFDILTLRVV
ncbi:fumarylacetoacetate hydrolase family protein [Mycetohabitans sp. B5]|uniref:Fumarylpyruvate hydrolase n=1 Tax=Mycetohabitans endofungorum TaxID=417203 RepID=A0A2P5KDV8_9BURK|nr:MULTISPECIES: fumarylacetoacetate hydrolase family protein [Mycetohabitans]MCG1055765.1 fumarylacetoacetate hydrolase family protein [Mycetohabitans sp. B5]PPB84884.1 fumarylpyruvate hydrolase [Mycetohabitans endofungorum]